MKKYLVALALVWTSSASCQTYSPASVGLSKSSTPYGFAVNTGTSWSQLGTVSPGGGWNIPVANIYNGASPILAGANVWAAAQTFSVAPIFSSLTGYMFCNASSACTASATVPISTGVGGLGTGVAAALALPVNTTGGILTSGPGGFGTAASENIGTSGATVPLLSTANTWSLAQTFSSAPTFSSLTGYLYCNGGSSCTASTTVPISTGVGGLGSGVAAALAVAANSPGGILIAGPSGFGTAAVENIGTSGATVPLLNGTNTWGSGQTFSVAPIFSTLTGYMFCNGSSACTASSTVPVADVRNGATALLSAANTWGGVQTLSVAPIMSTLTGYVYCNGGSACTAATTVPVATGVGGLGAGVAAALANAPNTAGGFMTFGTGGFGTAAYENIGTSGANVPLLSTANTWSLAQTFSSAPIIPSLNGYVSCVGSSPCTSSSQIPIASGVSGLAAGVATALAIPPNTTGGFLISGSSGLGTAAAQNIGTSGANVPLMSTANTWAFPQTFSAAPIYSTLTGYVYCNGASPCTAATSVPVGSVTNSSIPLLAANNTWSNLNTVATSGPAWSSYAGIWDQFAVNVNSYPASQAFGNNLTPIAGAISGYINIPSTASGGNHNQGVAGYAVTSSSSTGALGTFGFGGVSTNSASAWGLNSVTTNGISPQPASNSGYANNVLYGYELNFNIMRTPGGGNPNSAVRGIYMIGASEVQTSNIMTAIDIDSHGYFQNPRLPWKIGFNTNDGAVTNAVNIGAASQNTGSTSSSSQPITFNSYVSGSLRSSTISTDPFGNILLTPTTGTGAANIVPNGSFYPAVNNTFTLGLTSNRFAAAYLVGLGVQSAVPGATVAFFGNGTTTCQYTPGNTTFTCPSDARLKENVTDTSSALDYLRTLRIRDFVMKSDKSHNTGVIAQEVKETHPELVHKREDGYYVVDTVNVWKLVKAIQELKAENDNLKNDFAAIKAKLPR